MQNSFFNFLCSALIPELRADVSAGSAGNIHFILIGIAAIRAFPNQLAVVILAYFDLAVIPASLAVIALCIKLGVHYIIVNKLHNRNNRVDIVLQIRYFHVADRAARGKLLELGFEFQPLPFYLSFFRQLLHFAL